MEYRIGDSVPTYVDIADQLYDEIKLIKTQQKINAKRERKKTWSVKYYKQRRH